jgi:anhydro-N-acetylmuramic acid kinase
MSGTSMDGIDAALLKTDGQSIIHAEHDIQAPYTKEFKILLKSAERAVHDAQGDLSQAAKHYSDALYSYLTQELLFDHEQCQHTIKKLSQYVETYDSLLSHPTLTLPTIIDISTLLHAQAVAQLLQETNYRAADIDVIGYHGQTLFHCPHQGQTIQIGHGQQLATLTGICVINDFRRKDVEAGGQGAPLAPIYHQALASQTNKLPMAVVNCGGIANVSLIFNINIDDLLGFDTGPGNGLVDALIKKRTNGQKLMDEDGYFGLQGTIHDDIMVELFKHAIVSNGTSYFDKKPPKSLDIRALQLIPALQKLSLPDACATLEAFTAETIVHAMQHLIPASYPCPIHWVLAGGGGRNPVIRRELSARLQRRLHPDISLKTADEMHWNSRAMEGQLMAYCAVRRLKNLPISAPGTTGVLTPLPGGTLYTPKQGIPSRVHALLAHCKTMID